MVGQGLRSKFQMETGLTYLRIKAMQYEYICRDKGHVMYRSRSKVIFFYIRWKSTFNFYFMET